MSAGYYKLDRSEVLLLLGDLDNFKSLLSQQMQPVTYGEKIDSLLAIVYSYVY